MQSEFIRYGLRRLTRIIHEGFVMKGWKPIEMGAREDFFPQA